MNPAANPELPKDVQGDGRWISQHNRFLMEAKEKEPEVLFIGDSLIQNLARSQLWKTMFEPLHCLNFGIGGDQTQHVLWRVMNGELENIEPQVIVLLIGTNNYDHSAEQVADGILAIVTVIQKKQPKAQLVVMGIPPRGEHPNTLRDKIATINSILMEQLQDRDNVIFLPTDPSMFVSTSGVISHLDMYDYLHFTNRGYQKLCDSLLDLVQDLLQEFVKVENTSQETDSLAGDLASKYP